MFCKIEVKNEKKLFFRFPDAKIEKTDLQTYKNLQRPTKKGVKPTMTYNNF